VFSGRLRQTFSQTVVDDLDTDYAHFTILSFNASVHLQLRFYYACANEVVGGIKMFPVFSCVRPCVRPEQTLLARYFAYVLTKFDQTFSTTKRFRNKDKCITYFGSKKSRVKVTVESNILFYQSKKYFISIMNLP